jgi:hypothetical protein
MSLLFLVLSMIFFVLVGFKVNPPALSSVDLLGFGLFFFALSFFPFGSFGWNIGPRK